MNMVKILKITSGKSFKVIKLKQNMYNNWNIRYIKIKQKPFLLFTGNSEWNGHYSIINTYYHLSIDHRGSKNLKKDSNTRSKKIVRNLN